MATRPATHRPHSRLVRRHEPKVSRKTAPRYGQGRGGRPWRRLRLQVLERDGWLCQCDDCKAKQLPLPANEVDHISNDRDELDRLDDSLENLRAVNKECHKRISRRQAAEAGQIGTMMPSWLPMTSKPLTVVCGPPSAGKTTWVNEQAEADALIIDLDDLAIEVMGKPMWEMDSPERSQVIRARNALVADYMRGKTPHTKCYLIDTAGSFKRRKFWQDKGAEVVVLNVEKELCIQRIQTCKIKPESTRLGRISAVNRWE